MAIPPKGQFKVLRSTVSGERPPSWRLEGEPYVNIPDRTIGIIDKASEPSDIAAPFINYGGFVNKFRNPGFDIWQRGTSIGIPADGVAHTADGWDVYVSGAATTVVREAAWIEGDRDRASASFDLWIGGAAGIAFAQIGQQIESVVAAPLTSQRCTFQCWVYNETGAPLAPDLWIGGPTTIDGSGGGGWYEDLSEPLQTIPHATWRRVAYTFQASSQWVNGGGCWLSFENALNGAGKWIGIAECDLRATPGAPLGLCDNSPPPEIRPETIERLICQRYYEKSYEDDVAPGTPNAAGQELIYWGSTGVHQSQMIAGAVKFKVSKRVTPSIAIYSAISGQAGVVHEYNVGGPLNAYVWGQGENGFMLYSSQGEAAAASWGCNQQFHWVASAEL